MLKLKTHDVLFHVEYNIKILFNTILANISKNDFHKYFKYQYKVIVLLREQESMIEEWLLNIDRSK